ncbi:MAG: hypothetical protein ACTSRS_13185 [Candidatus Helarchaeota archaeon]
MIRIKFRYFLILFFIGVFFGLGIMRCGTIDLLALEVPLEVQGDGHDPSDPLTIYVDTYYGLDWQDYFSTYDFRYLQVYLNANAIYFVFHESTFLWDVGLFNDSSYSVLLGVPISVPEGQFSREYLTFSPNRTGFYYIKLYKENIFTSLNFAVLSATSYTLNTSHYIVIHDSIQPIYTFQTNISSGTYSCSYPTLAVKVSLGQNYGVSSSSYQKFPQDTPFQLEAGQYLLLIEETCEFSLTLISSKNQTESAPFQDSRFDFFGEFSPIFAIGILIGIYVLYTFHKKK